VKNRNVLISLSIIAGLVLACAVLPLGGFALLLVAAGGSSTPGGVTIPERVWQEQVVSGSGQERVLILNVEGVIGAPDDGLLASSISHEELLSQIDQATEDPDIAAVVVHVNSPGGGVVASQQIHDALVELRDSGKNLVVSMDSTAASGGYYIATPAERIYANADTLTGSLGVIITLLNYQEAFNSLGLEQRVFKSGEFKDIGSPVRELSDEEEQILQSIVDQAYEGFVDVIVEGRDLPRDEVLELADGRVYTGQQALDVGLVDELGSLDEALIGAREMAGLPEDALVVRYSATPGFLDLLQASVESQQQQQADPLGLRNLTEPQVPRLEYRMVMP
jgi:protease-4